MAVTTTTTTTESESVQENLTSCNAQQQVDKQADEAFFDDMPMQKDGSFENEPFNNLVNSVKQRVKKFARGTTALASTGAAAYKAYSDYQVAGLQLSGATHSASVQSRKGNMASDLTGLGIAIAINPVLAAPMIAMKAYQLAQTNRKELFAIRKSQIESEVLQRNLVQNVAESRF